MITPGRKPEQVAPHRIEPLATLPVFHKLRGRKVVLAGGGDGALWKAELLSASGAVVQVIAPEFCEGFDRLAANPPDGSIALLKRRWSPEDLAGAAIAVADTEDDREAQTFADAARAAGAPVNVIDRPGFCDFQFGAIINRSPMVVAVSTDGAAPVFGQAIRAKIEGLLPRGLKNWAQAAQDWRNSVQQRALPYALRRRFWERFTALALQAAGREPMDADRSALLNDIDEASEKPAGGRVSLVGAGPGDPELLTLKAVRTLQAADVILYDDLVSPEVLELARREAKRMLVGKTGHGPSCKQSDINEMMVTLARQGRHVVRLKSGDPGIFGRAGEEIAACREGGLPVEIIPGISSAQGAAASLGISLTERDKSRRLQFVTGHGKDGKLPRDLQWNALADPSATTIVYMPRKSLAELRDKALAAGIDPATPAAGMLSVSRPNEARVVATITTLPDRLDELPMDGPVLVLIGRVLETVIEANDLDTEGAAGSVDPALKRQA